MVFSEFASTALMSASAFVRVALVCCSDSLVCDASLSVGMGWLVEGLGWVWLGWGKGWSWARSGFELKKA